MARSDVINGGYIGKILRVDLTKGKLQDEILDPDVLRKYVGGLGVAAKIMYDEVSPNIMPYDAENLVVFMTGPLTGTVAPGSSRYVVYTLNSFNPKVCSPGFGGGYWAFELKRSGYDGIIIQGNLRNLCFCGFIMVQQRYGMLAPYGGRILMKLRIRSRSYSVAK